MSKAKKDAVPERPSGGGSYIRDRKTGKLTKQEPPAPAAVPPADLPPAEPGEGETSKQEA